MKKNEKGKCLLFPPSDEPPQALFYTYFRNFMKGRNFNNFKKEEIFA